MITFYGTKRTNNNNHYTAAVAGLRFLFYWKKKVVEWSARTIIETTLQHPGYRFDEID